MLANYEILYRNHYLLIKRREENRRCSRWLRMAIFPLSSGVQKLGVKDCRKAIQRCPVCTAAYLFFFFSVWFNFILPVNEGWFSFLLFKCISCDAHIYLFWTKVKIPQLFVILALTHQCKRSIAETFILEHDVTIACHIVVSEDH